MTAKKSQETYTKIYWAFTTFMLLSAMPLGIVLIFVKLFERRRKGKVKKVFRPVSDAPLGAQTIRPGASSPVRESLEEASRKMRRRTATGLVLSVLSLALMAFCAVNDINLWMIFWCSFCSLYLLYTGLHYLFSVSRFRDYVSIMEKRPVMSVGDMAAATGLSEKTIKTDWMNVEFMELLPGIFFDRSRDLLFCF